MPAQLLQNTQATCSSVYGASVSYYHIRNYYICNCSYGQGLNVAHHRCFTWFVVTGRRRVVMGSYSTRRCFVMSSVYCLWEMYVFGARGLPARPATYRFQRESITHAHGCAGYAGHACVGSSVMDHPGTTQRAFLLKKEGTWPHAEGCWLLTHLSALRWTSRIQ